MEQKLSELYYNPETGLTSAKQLYEQLRDTNYSVNDVKKWLSKQETHQIFKKPKKQYATIYGRTNADYQMDSMFLDQFKRQNSGYIGLLTFIEITSRKGYAIPIKSKFQKEINRAFNEFYKQVNGNIINITSDNEASFKNAVKQHKGITHWLSDVDDKTKVGKIERFNRTIREKITKYMKTFKTAKWIDVIDKLLTNYNNSVHSSIKKAPNKVTEEDFNVIQVNEMLKGRKAYEEHSDLNINDKVRLLKPKGKFAKGSETYSRGIYTIIDKQGLSFKLENPKGTKLLRNYKSWQLQKINSHEKAPEKEAESEITSFKEIQKVNKFKNKQKREFNKGKKHEIKEITDEGVVKLKDRLLPKYETRRQDPKETIINKRISVYWPQYKHWYSGTVSSYDTDRKEHIVTYDQQTTDGDNDIFEKLYENNDKSIKKVRWKYI